MERRMRGAKGSLDEPVRLAGLQKRKKQVRKQVN